MKAEDSNAAADDPVLEVRNLRVRFAGIGGFTDAVKGVNFTLRRGKTLALVGESGSGKSVTSYSILRLIQKPGEITAGQIIFNSRTEKPVDIAALSSASAELFRIRGGKISMIFQEPMTALSPVHTVGNQICEAIRLHQKQSRRQADELAMQMLAKVGISDPARRMKQYPFEFSGGMRQRVVIAMALVCRPEILIADEPTTALDVTIQAQILQLIRDLQREMSTSVLFITHDLGVVAQVADDVAVMRRGRVVESAPVRDLYRRPIHPYTQRLLDSIAERGESIPSHRETFPLPPGYTFDEPDSHPSIEPVLHQLPDGRQVLLWPTSSEVLA